MELSQMPFVYSSFAINALSNLLSSDRLHNYIIDSTGDKLLSIQLYERNTELSQSMYGVIQPLEIALRNSVHNVMRTDLGNNGWLEKITLQPKEREAVDEAKKTIYRRGKPVTPGRLVAELTFGFWLRLLAPNYEKYLWVPHLHRCFPHMKSPDRRKIFDRFFAIKELRNKVAHHESIIQRNLSQDYRDIIEALGWICPVTACWIQATNSLQRVLSR
jgi:Abi-like protein